MPAPIVVALEAPSPPSVELEQALIDACSRAVGGDGCDWREEDGGGPPLASVERQRPRAVAVVTFDGASYDHVRVEVRAARNDAKPKTGVLDFRTEDRAADRFGATGLLVASLARALDPTLDRDRSGQPPLLEARSADLEPSANPDKKPAVAQADEPCLAALAAGVLVAGGAPIGQVGGFLSAEVPFVGPRAFGSMSLAFARYAHPDSAGVSAQWLALGVGAGGETTLGRPEIVLRAEAELVLQTVQASIHEPGTALEDAGSRLLTGFMSEADLALRLSKSAGLVVGWRVGWVSDSTVVRVHDKAESLIPQGMYAGLAGLRVELR